MVVLWSFRKGDMQLGSPEDLRQAAIRRQYARAFRRFARAMAESRIALNKLGMTAREATDNLNRLARLGERLQKGQGDGTG